MRRTNGDRITELIQQVAKKDRVNPGVAKARFAGKANYSVPSLERLMRGERASEDQQDRTLSAAKSWGMRVSRNELFPPVGAGEEEAS